MSMELQCIAVIRHTFLYVPSCTQFIRNCTFLNVPDCNCICGYKTYRFLFANVIRCKICVQFMIVFLSVPICICVLSEFIRIYISISSTQTRLHSEGLGNKIYKFLKVCSVGLCGSAAGRLLANIDNPRVLGSNPGIDGDGFSRPNSRSIRSGVLNQLPSGKKTGLQKDFSPKKNRGLFGEDSGTQRH